MTAYDFLLWFGLAVALAYLPMTAAASGWPRSLVKSVPLLAFALAALVGAAPLWLVAGLLLSAMGDFALSRDGERAFLAGLAAFALAHVSYIGLFLGLSNLPPWDAFAVHTALALALVVFGLSAEIWLVAHTGNLRWPVRVYVLVITIMGLAVLTLPLALATLGAGLFIASDTMLAVQLFRLREGSAVSKPLGRAVWVFYIAGQALILLGAG